MEFAIRQQVRLPFRLMRARLLTITCALVEKHGARDRASEVIQELPDQVR